MSRSLVVSAQGHAGLQHSRPAAAGCRPRPQPSLCIRGAAGVQALRQAPRQLPNPGLSRGPSGAGPARSLRVGAGAVSEAGTAEGCVVVIDNYDSFTYNLCQYLGDLGCRYIVFKNDEKTVEEIKTMKPAGILVSPGPGRPEDSGISLEIIEKLGPEGIPTFGVCMGHQCIGQVFGGQIIRAPCGVMHGKSSPVTHTGVGVLEGMPNPFQAARYHSLVIDKDSCPEDIVPTAWTEDGTIMACHHRVHTHIQGVQFHPESVITDNGMTIVGNFVKSLQIPAAVE